MRSSLMQLLVALVVLVPLRTGAADTAVVIVGKSDAHAREVAGAAVSAAVSKADKLSDKRLSEADTASITRCFSREEPQRCILRLVQDKGVQSLAYISVDPDPDGDERSIKLTGRVITTKLDLVMVAWRFCDHCTDDTLAGSATKLVKDLLDRVASSAGRTVLSIKSSPQGARYTFDGTFVGVTDASIDVTPGPHTVAIELDGFETYTQSVSATEGKTVEVNAVFRGPNPNEHPGSTPGAVTRQAINDNRTDARTDPPHRSRAAMPLIIGGGVLAAAGVAILSFDQDSVTRPAGTLQPAGYYDTTTPAIATFASGVAIVGIGAYLYWKSPGATTTAAIRPTSTGTMMTLSTSF